MIYELSPLTAREELADLLINHGLNSSFVEVGVHRGFFMQSFCRRWPGKYYGVDIWKEYDPTDPTSTPNRIPDMKMAQAIAEEYGSHLIHKPSIEAAKDFPDDSIDCVYIDANHQTESVLSDLSVWWPKVRPGGILAGHDIICPNETNGGWGPNIQTALNSFFPTQKRCYFIREEHGAWSYYIWKN